jgi:hypothetical protein
MLEMPLADHQPPTHTCKKNNYFAAGWMRNLINASAFSYIEVLLKEQKNSKATHYA